MKKLFLALLSAAALTQAIEPTSELLKQFPTKDSISYFMVGASAPVREDLMSVIAPNLSYGMRHFSGIHAKDYFVSAKVNQQVQTLTGQYSFLLFPITSKGFAKTHSSFYLGAGLAGGASYLSKSTAKKARDLEIKRHIKREKITDAAKIAETTQEMKKNDPSRIIPSFDLPLTAGYQFANTNFVQVQFSTLAFVAPRISDLSENNVYATINYGFGF